MATTHRTLQSLAALRAVSELPEEGSTVRIVDYYDQTAGTPFGPPGGGGLYRWDPGSGDHPDNGAVVAPNAAWNSGPGDWDDGRWLLVHDGAVTVRQFGALGVEGGTPKAVADLDGAGSFVSDAEMRATFAGGHGEAFSGLRDEDTADWAAIQAALVWCGANGVRLEGNAGVYRLRRPLWLGDDDVDYDQPEGEDKHKDSSQQGLTFAGQDGNSREQADGGVCNLRLTQDCSNRYCLSANPGTEDSDQFYLLLPPTMGAGGYTTVLSPTSTAQAVANAIEAVLGPAGEVVLDVPNTAAVKDQNVYFRIVLTSQSPAFLGPIVVTENTSSVTEPALTYVVRCLPDSGIVSFRRSAGFHYRLEGLSLKGNDGAAVPEPGQPGTRYASFGVLFATSQFVGHVVERVNAFYADTVLGVLEGTGANGEDLYLARIKADRCRRGYYSDAPQSFGHDLVSWTLGLDQEGVYIELDRAGQPGFGLTCVGVEGTFENNDEAEVVGRGTFFRLRRGTGAVTATGGRVEHCATLLHYDSANGQGLEDNLDFSLEGMDFDGMRVTEGRSFLFGEASEGSPTQFGLVARNCRFKLKDGADASLADLRLTSQSASDGLRCSFEACRFTGWRSVPSLGVRAGFRQCYRSDFDPGLVGAGGAALREFTETAGTPGQRVQSVRTVFQDTPWAQTGPRTNVLKNSDLKGQEQSASASSFVAFSVAGWSIAGGADAKAVFGKWGKFAEASLNPGPESFYLKLRTGQSVSATMGFVDLDGSGTKVATYQGLLRVSGKARLSLVNSVDGSVYDSVELEDTESTTLVTLRGQVTGAAATDSLFRLVLANAGPGECAFSVLWQQAWGGGSASATYPLEGGLANAGQVRTPGNQEVRNTYPWAVNAIGVKAASRFQLPLLDTAAGGDAAAMGWRSTVTAGDYDLQDGEVYMDENLRSMLGRADLLWYQFVQPDRVLLNPADNSTWDATLGKNLVYDGNANRTLTLSTDLTKVPRGSVVRVFCFVTVVNGTVTVKVGSSNLSVVGVGKMSEFLFYVDSSNNGRWLLVQGNAMSGRI